MTEDHQMTALHRIDKHEAVCTERYGSIDNKLNTATAQMSAMSTQLHSRLDGVDRQMWWAARSTIVMAICAIGALVVIIFKH